MRNVVEFASFSLKNGTSSQNFLSVSDKFNREFLSKQKGYISRNLVVDGKTWADLVLWETMEDALTALDTAEGNAAACEYISFLNEESISVRHFSVEKKY